ncbi:SlyX family protein [Hoeflea ulvae]|uniref:SlyX family protein n=1 Tax=Hoeflea ulvae TaxID=2983764 RepID=A0ABT3YAW4_9HYPH|nr:SlyX family protein [Hoeflea ulvae]MCY0092937.1 SlyX family protein [Hoeflea ulvae]
MTDPVELRLVKLEELVAHQSTAIEDLSRQLADQWKLTQRLRDEYDQLTNRFEEVEEAALGSQQPQKPPHW